MREGKGQENEVDNETNLAYPIPRDAHPLAMNRMKRDKHGHTPVLRTYAQTEEEDTSSHNRDVFAITQQGAAKRTLGRSSLPIVRNVLEIRCSFSRTATRRLTQNNSETAN